MERVWTPPCGCNFSAGDASVHSGRSSSAAQAPQLVLYNSYLDRKVPFVPAAGPDSKQVRGGGRGGGVAAKAGRPAGRHHPASLLEPHSCLERLSLGMRGTGLQRKRKDGGRRLRPGAPAAHRLRNTRTATHTHTQSGSAPALALLQNFLPFCERHAALCCADKLVHVRPHGVRQRARGPRAQLPLL